MTSPSATRLKVAWINDFPVEWLPELPETLRHLPRMHARSWQQVLLQEFQKNPELELHILVLRKNIRKNVTFQQSGATFHVLKVPRGSREQSFYWVDTFLIRRALRQIQPDLVHAWGTERGAHLIAKRLAHPYLVTIQGLVTWYAELIPLNPYERFAAWLEKFGLPHAPLVTTESSFALNYLHNHFPGLRVLQAEHAPNPVFQRLVRKPQTLPTRFLFVGHLGFRKGADLLISALEQIQDDAHPFQLVVIGEVDPPYREALNRMLASQVIFRKNLNANEIAEELSRATMMLFPTRADTSPNAVKEAIVAGVPVVASAIGGIIDYVFPGKNGFTFPSENVQVFRQAILDARNHPLFSRGLVEPETLARTRLYLSAQKMGNRFCEAYEILAGRQPMPTTPRLTLPT